MFRANDEIHVVELLHKRNFRISFVKKKKKENRREREILQCMNWLGGKDWLIVLIFSSEKVAKSSRKTVNKEEEDCNMPVSQGVWEKP